MVETGLLNRELSWLAFDERVLALAGDAHLPVLERARFLAIFARNLDEFFQIRVSGLLEQREEWMGARSPDGLTAFEQLRQIRARCLELTDRANGILYGEVIPALADAEIAILDTGGLAREEVDVVASYFDDHVFPVLTPLSVDPAHPFPYVSDLSLNIAAMVIDPADGDRRFVRVKVPPSLRRLVPMPDGRRFVSLERIIGAHLGRLFPGMEIASWDIFRVTRDADLDMLDEGDDFVEMVRSGLERRKRGARAVRLECAETMDAEVLDLLLRELELGADDLYPLSPLPLDALWHLDLDRAELRFPRWEPITPPALVPDAAGSVDVFAAIAARDLLLHHPYDSFTTSVAAFVEAAAADPSVLTIKQTLYRTSSEERRIIQALIRAAESGKQVVALVELKARFDEETNIAFAEALEHAGVHVVYGIVGLKAHAKLLLVVRREDERLRTYAHVGTGNYNPLTSRTYEDLGLLTADPRIGADLTDAFNLLTGYGRWSGRHALLAPYELRDALTRSIAGQAHPGGRIVMKMNSLVDPEMITELCTASQAGADVDLIVRGICCLRPDVEGISERVRVRSIVGRFLEHSRVFRFGEGVDALYLIGSADLMPRNLDRRVEALIPIHDPEARARIDTVLTLALADDTFAWELDSSGTWSRVPTKQGISVHAELMQAARVREASLRRGRRVALVRHAVAAPRAGWRAADLHRPLLEDGVRQARVIADRVLAGGDFRAVWSSPYRRCVETGTPIAEAIGIPVTLAEGLGEGAEASFSLDLILGGGPDCVIATHGDVLRKVVDALVAQGAVIDGEPSWTKGTIWWIDASDPAAIRLRAEATSRDGSPYDA